MGRRKKVGKGDDVRRGNVKRTNDGFKSGFGVVDRGGRGHGSGEDDGSGVGIGISVEFSDARSVPWDI